MSNAHPIGTPALDPYGTAGFIAAVKPANVRAFTIGANGLQAEKHVYVMAWESGRISELSDGIAKPFIDRALTAGLPIVTDIEERRSAIEAKQAEAQAAARAERERAQNAQTLFYAEAEKRTPSWAQAVIVAELIEDDSDIMTDYHGSKTKRTVILGFSKHTRDLFPELRKAAATFKETAHLADAPASAEHREKYSMGAGYYLKTGFRDSDGWRIKKYKFYGNGFRSIPVGEWHEPEQAAEPAPVPASAAIDGIRIEQHTHSKKGFEMFICILPERVDRAEYDRLLEAAKALGGWYSKPWGKTPGGFAFKVRENAEAFAGNAQPAATDAPVASVTPKAGNSSLAEKFRDMADKLQSDIDSKFRDRLTNTPKRQREAASARLDGWHLKRTQSALRALADLHESGNVPACLSAIRSKADVMSLMRSVIDHSRGGYYDAGIDLNKPAKDTEQARTLWAMIGDKSEVEKQAEKLRAKIESLQFANIPGYFPTPANLVSDMIDAAKLPEGCRVLEPSAGSGAIVDGIKARVPSASVDAFERHSSLRDILQMKGANLIGSDFTEAEPVPSYDYVLMNPPFENGQDMEHVRHAFAFLKPGGRLVAIMSPGPFYRSDRKAAAFREWFDDLNGYKTDIAAGAFKESGTGIATVMIVIDA